MPQRKGQRRGQRARRLSREATRRVMHGSRTAWDQVLAALDRLGLDEHAILLLFGALIGVAAGAGVVAFYRVIDLSYAVFFEWPERVLPQLPRLFYRPIATALALGVAWWTWRRLGRGQDGMTVPDVQLAVVRRGGRIHPRRAFGRTLASAMTIGGGGSAGSEGPVAVLGSAIGSLVSRVFNFTADRTRVLVGAGAAAAISAAFNAPLAGAFFALEEILGSFRVAHFAPVVVASVAGAILSRSVFGNHPAFLLPEAYSYQNTIEVALFFPLLGVICGIVSVFFIRWYFGFGAWTRALHARYPRGQALMPWVAGAVVGGMVVTSRGMLVGTGHLSIPLDAFAQTAWWALLLLAIGKIVATTITLHGGGSGGLFTPSLFVGGAVGSAMGVLIRAWIPAIAVSPEAYALVGMGAVVAATTGAPLTAILLVFEITGDYAIVPPLMVAVVICQLFTKRFERDDLYSGWLRRKGITLSHGADRDILGTLTVADALDREAVTARETDAADALLLAASQRDQHVVPVVDAQHHLLGVITLGELGVAAREPHATDAARAAFDLMQRSEAVSIDDSLLVAIRRMGVRGLASLPVIEPATGQLVGIVDRGHILTLYDQAVSDEPDDETDNESAAGPDDTRGNSRASRTSHST